ncbi:hypothetical protein GCM10010412_066210 [Nonomuraea recticatena]|uniref:Uncharacterized protein n=1 Tax=Nonomuraea recticatena TaxID=46178 RepID=A0ABP6F556_9ACTN
MNGHPALPLRHRGGSAITFYERETSSRGYPADMALCVLSCGIALVLSFGGSRGRGEDTTVGGRADHVQVATAGM